ncbi:putative glycoside hydrolase [Lyophyllum shimeji]|uniref:Glycoside hydrolase n=1 Tax=Lyophyllum shimeji TaxID=47721 RepID=A0A9P3Q0K7_LYOSH|nr:putative glycoside hydrolase [Lyophyllum shimeji]
MMTLTDEVKREIGQHFVFGFHGHEVSEDIKTLIQDYHLGSIILMKRNVHDAKQVRGLIRQLQTIAKEAGHERPLLIGIDQENGLVSAFSSPTAGTQFPGAMALAATGSVDIAFDVSAATAKELKMVGINWAYSPVADVNSDSRNPVIGVRSFGDNPADVARYASAVARGLTSSGVAPSAKHFPGHGDTHIDSHLALPRIMKSKDELKRTELVPFEHLVQGINPVASVMIGHMALPGLTGDDTPASLSPVVTKELLRKEMGYDGVVVTDCLEMDAIAVPLQGGCGVEEGAIRSLASGIDVVMVCHTFARHIGSIKATYAAVESGRLNFSDLVEGGKRIARMKETFIGGWSEVLGEESDDAAFEEAWKSLKAGNTELSRKAYQMSSTVVRGKDKLPLKLVEEAKVVLFTPAIESLNKAVDDADGVLMDAAGRLRNTAGPSYLALADQVQKRAKTRHVVYSPNDIEVKGITADVGAVIFVLRNADRSVWQTQYLDKVVEACKAIPVVLLASCGPYDLAGRADLRDRTAYVASFEFRREAFEAFVAVVFDGLEGPGRVPVGL